MKTLKRNETEFTYKAFVSKTEIMNNGKHTGKYKITYADPVTYRGNISLPYGQAFQQLFGIETPYTHVLLMDDPKVNILESGVIEWKGKEYVITAVRPSLNVLAVALKQTVKVISDE